MNTIDKQTKASKNIDTFIDDNQNANGKLSELCLTVGSHSNTTTVHDLYYTTPNKLLSLNDHATSSNNYNEDALVFKKPPLKAMLMSSAPGLMAGDSNTIDINLLANSGLDLNTQAYQRILSMECNSQAATQKINVHMEDDSALYFHPHPYVLHRGSQFYQSNRFYLQNNCRLLFTDIMACGRVSNQEKFEFKDLHSLTEIYVLDKIHVKEKLSINPQEDEFKLLGFMEDYTHLAGLYFVQTPDKTSTKAYHLQSLVDDMYDFLEMNIKKNSLNQQSKQVLAGITQSSNISIKVSALGHHAEQLINLMNQLSNFIMYYRK